MSFPLQITLVILVYFIFTANFIFLARQFKLALKFQLPLHTILLVFTFGFILRLTYQPQLLDLGFFLTDITAVFISTLFVFTLLLGQIKYWKLS